MEFALNLIWAVIAVVSYSLLFCCDSGRGPKLDRGTSRSQSVVALTCFLAIVFPIISLSDDLQEMQATLEEASTSVLAIKKSVVTLSLDHQRTLHRIPFLLASNAPGVQWTVLGILFSHPTPRSLPGQLLVEIGRSPPSLAIDRIS
jgi:hypothetical protein